MIPKVIHYIWLGGNPLNELAEKCIASWQKMCPDYEIKRWDESNLNLDINKYCRQAYDAKKYAFASDVLRYQILKENGGIYLDVDVELLKPLDEFLDNKLFLGFENKKFIAPGLIIGVEKNNEHMAKLLDGYSNREFINKDGTYDLTTVCKITTDYLLELGMKQNNKAQSFAGITLYPTEYFNPYNYQKKKLQTTANTVSIHWYMASWVTPPTFKQKVARFFKNVLKFIIGEKNYIKLKNKIKGN